MLPESCFVDSFLSRDQSAVPNKLADKWYGDLQYG